jgi:hypothetical protein
MLSPDDPVKVYVSSSPMVLIDPAVVWLQGIDVCPRPVEGCREIVKDIKAKDGSSNLRTLNPRSGLE